ncbi:MAG TPA: VOC family protein [Candidatus Cybelea sp.]|nr:VOC family protein [Candidatus Cybelea sp.]
MPQPPFALTGLDHVVLRVVDLDRMLSFYRDALGCVLEREQPQLGLTQLRAGRSLIDLVTVDGVIGQTGGAAPGAEGRNMDHLCLAIDAFDEGRLRGHLGAHGAEIVSVGKRYGAEGMGPSMYVRDPEGNIVELKGPGG